MNRVSREEEEKSVSFLFCKTCEVCCLEPETRAVLPPPSPTNENDSDLSKLPPEAAKTIALIKVKKIAEEARGYVPEPAWWEWLISYLGFPTSLSEEEWVRFPWAVLSVVLLSTVTSVYSFSHYQITQDWSFVPSQWNRVGGLTSVSSFFLHGNWEHLLGNMYFLLLFGLSIENRIGSLQFLVILLISSFVGDLATYLYNPQSSDGGIGASGGIAGVMLFFAFAFPKRLILLWGMAIPSVVFIVIWFLFQGIYASIQVKGWEDGIGYYAHLGGGLFGWAYWLLMRKRLDLQWKPKKKILDT